MTTTAQITKKSNKPIKTDAPKTQVENSSKASQPNGKTTAIELIPNFTERIVEKQIEIALIDRSETQPRKIFDEAAIAEIGASIKTTGLLQAVLVRPKGDRFELVFGERRWRGSLHAGLTTIRANVAVLTDEEVFDIQVHENLHRRDLKPLEEAESYAHLLATVKLYGQPLTEERLAERVNKDIKYVVSRLLLNKLFPEAKEDLRNEFLMLNLALVLIEYSLETQIKAYRYCYQTEWKDGQHVPIKTRPVNVRFLRDKIRSEVLLALDHAPFPIDSEKLREDKLTCPQCPNRTGANTLFADPENDFCMNSDCFQQKTMTFVQIQRSKVATENIIEKIKTDYQEKIEKTKIAVQTADKTEKKTIQNEQGRLKAELSDINKIGLESEFVQIKEDSVKKQAAKVLFITDSYYSNDEKILGDKDYTAINNTSQRCEYTEKAIFADGAFVGKIQEICRSKSCKKHHQSSSSSTTKREQKTGEELKTRKSELFNIRTANKTRVKVVGSCKDKITQPKKFWSDRFFQRLIAANLLVHLGDYKYSHRFKLVADLLGVDKKELEPAKSVYTFDVDVFATIDALEKFDDEFLVKLIFLTLAVSFGENNHESSKVSNDSVRFIAEKFGVDEALLDAASRVELCNEKKDYKKYLLDAQNYLKDIKGQKEEQRKNLKVPNFWE